MIAASKLVNQLGKYLYKHIDGAYEYEKSPNTFDIYMTVYYQVPQLSDKPGRGITYSDIYEMDLNLNLTTYSNKIRMNIIEISPEEQTVGFDVIPPEKLEDLPAAQNLILSRVEKRLRKYFDGYEFLF